MALSKNLATFKSETKLWQSLLTKTPVLIPLDRANAVRLRMRLYHVRTLLAAQSNEILAHNDPDRGVTPYDAFVLRIVPEGLLIEEDPVHITKLTLVQIEEKPEQCSG